MNKKITKISEVINLYVTLLLMRTKKTKQSKKIKGK